MSAPPGFNPDSSLLPDVNAPIRVMTGGGDPATQPTSSVQSATSYTPEERKVLEKYGGLQDINEITKRAFLAQEASARCSSNTGDATILSADCWAVQAVIRNLIQKAIKRSNSELTYPKLVPSKPRVSDDKSNTDSTSGDSITGIADSTDSTDSGAISNTESVKSTDSTETKDPEPHSVDPVPSKQSDGKQSGGGKKATRFFRRLIPKGKKARKTRKTKHT
jgi:hypothetical protein